MNELAERTQAPTPAVVEDLIARGDLSKLTPQQRIVHYNNVCTSLGLNPLTEPLQYVTLNGRLKLYAKKDATDQLRKLNGISLTVLSRSVHEGVLTVTVRATDKTGRQDEDIGAVPILNLRGEAAANAMMKAVTKAKRRVTLSISGLGFADESELDPTFATEEPVQLHPSMSQSERTAAIQSSQPHEQPTGVREDASDTGPAPTEEAQPAAVSEGERWEAWASQLMERVRAQLTVDEIDNVIARNTTRLASYQRHDAAAYQRLVEMVEHAKAARNE